MKRKIIIPGLLIISSFSLLFSGLLFCSTYSVKTEVQNSSAISKVKDTGIIFRLSKNGKLTEDDLTTNFSYWLSVHKKNKNISIISHVSDSIASFKNPQERFYQLSNEDGYLKYKSIGVLNLYLRNNEEALKDLIIKNQLDNLIIFEVFSVISTELQFIEFETVLAVVDTDLNIIYMDHQSDGFNSKSSFINDLKNQISDMINGRLIDNMQALNLIGGLTESAKKAAHTDSKLSEKQNQQPSSKAQSIVKDKPAEKSENTKEVLPDRSEPYIAAPVKDTVPVSDIKPISETKSIPAQEKPASDETKDENTQQNKPEPADTEK